MKKINASRENALKLPEVAGVYMFVDLDLNIIYVGKAKNLKNRVYSYFGQKLGPKTSQMVANAKELKYIPVESEFEALLLEAKLVKKYKPKYNIELRDDKSPLYIGITKEELPRVILLRQRELGKINLREVYGPFVNTTAPKKVLRLVRRIFPYSTHKPGKRPCVYHQIGLCNPCPAQIKNAIDSVERTKLKKEYLLNIRRVKAVLSGKSKVVVNQLDHEMREASKVENFEEASELKRKMDALLYTISREELNREYLENPNLLDDIRARELRHLAKYISKHIKIDRIKRIECYDVAHFAGTNPTASMVTFVNGEPDKSLYRHFRVHKGNSDTDNMKEVLRRRKKYFESWGKPDLIIVDGGKGQLSAALGVVGDEIAVVGLAKREETLVFKAGDTFSEFKLPEGPAKKLVQRLRDEAHRFARSYHHKLVSKAISDA
jgi:excinuclease ABC subunit C